MLLAGCDPTPEPSSIEVDWGWMEGGATSESDTIRTLGMPVPGPELRVSGGLVPRPRMVCGGTPMGDEPRTPCRGKERYEGWKPTCSVAPAETAMPSGEGVLSMKPGQPGGLVVNADYTLTATVPGNYTVTCTVTDTDATASYDVMVDPVTPEMVLEADTTDAHGEGAFWVGERIQARWPVEQMEPAMRVAWRSSTGETVDLDRADALLVQFESSDPAVMAVVPDRLELEARAPGTATITARLRDAVARAEVTVLAAPRLRITSPKAPLWIGTTCQVGNGATPPNPDESACVLGVHWERDGSAFDIAEMAFYGLTTASTRPDVLEVQGSTLTARAAGTSTVVVYLSGARASTEVTVIP